MLDCLSKAPVPGLAADWGYYAAYILPKMA